MNTHCIVVTSKSNHRSSLKLTDKEVHLREELQEGHFVEYWKRSDKSSNNEKDHVTGIVVSLVGRNDRKFQMHLISYQNKFSKHKEWDVNLNTEYHPAHCYTMDKRVQRAFEGRD